MYSGDTVTMDIKTVGAGCPLTSGSDTPQGQTGVSITNSSEWMACGSSAMTSHFRYNGGPIIGDPYATGYPNACWWNSALGNLEGHATGSEVQIVGFEYNNAFSLYQDGVSVGSRVKFGGSTVFSVASLGSGFSGTHLYTIMPSSGNVQFQVVIIAAVRFVGGVPTGTAPTGKPLIIGYGDSIIGSGSGPDDSTTTDWGLASAASGYAAQIFTLSGQNVSPTLRDDTYGVIPFSNTSPDLVVLEGGENDVVASIPIGTSTTANTFQGDMVTMIRNVQTSAHPPTHLLVRGILPNAYTNNGSRTTYTAAQAAAVAYVNSTYSTNVCYYDTTGWISGSPNGHSGTDDTADALHPYGATSLSAPGYGKIANREIPIFEGKIDGSSFDISGPSSGTNATTSTNFTVALRHGATWHGENVTLNDGGAGGTFTPSIGSPGTGPLAVTTPNNGSSSWTFTYTPSSTGAKTITYSGLANCWTAPSNTSYTSNSGGGGGGGTTTIPFSVTVTGTGVAPYPVTISGNVVITN